MFFSEIKYSNLLNYFGNDAYYAASKLSCSDSKWAHIYNDIRKEDGHSLEKSFYDVMVYLRSTYTLFKSKRSTVSN